MPAGRPSELALVPTLLSMGCDLAPDDRAWDTSGGGPIAF
jgi:hypothetical protein